MLQPQQSILLQSISEADRCDRVSIAKQLHNSLSSDLTAINFFLASLDFVTEPEKQSEIFKMIKNTVDTALKSSAAVSQRIMPFLPGVTNFVSLIKDLMAKTFEDRIAYSLVSSCELKISELVYYNLYKITERFITTAALRKDVSKFSLRIFESDNQLMLEFEDNGKQDSLYNLSNSAFEDHYAEIMARLEIIEASIVRNENIIATYFTIIIKSVKC